jgi:hypothetical protein
MMTQYRIVRDTYAGYEVQVRRWWFPLWVPLGFSNTHTSIERAEAWMKGAIKEEVKRL